MDEKSLEMIEFPKVRGMIAAHTSFSTSRELALSLQPLVDRDAIALLLRQSAEARHLLSIRPGFSIAGVIDVRTMTHLASAGRVLTTADLANIQTTLAATRNLRTALSKLTEEVPSLWEVARQIVLVPLLETAVDRCISPAGDVLDTASQRLEGIRQRSRRARLELQGRLQAFVASARGKKVLQEPIITEREGRFVIPVKIEFRKEVKGIVHDMSNTGQTIFVEPWMTLDLGNQLRELAIEEHLEVERILADLSNRVGEAHGPISANVVLAAQLDIALAKARYAEKARAIEPFIAGAKGTEAAAGQKAGALRFVNARHPLLTGEVVPLSLNLGDKYRVLVISGPNTGGKTVALKTIGLLAVMVQAGLPVPVGEGTCLPVFDSIFADIGDEQSIEQTLSTFSWHMGNIVRIIEGCTGRSLVLLDELGTSTDPSEGIALARAILLHFCDRGVMSVATTHYNDLKIAAQTTPGMRNASFDFDPQSLKPTYHLTFGVPGSSNALAIAARLGLPQELILTAREMKSKAAREVEAVLRDLTAERQKAAELRADLQRAAQEMESRGVAFEAEMQTLREQEQASFREVKTRLFREAADLRRQIRLASAELKKATSKKAVERARRTMAAFHERLSADNLSVETPLAQKKAPAMAAVEPLSVGDRVWLGDVGVWGTVTAAPDPEGQVEAQVGNVRLKLDSQEVERRPEEGEQARQFAVVRRGSRTGLSSLELDLRGRRAEQVEPELDAYLNEAFLAHLPEVRVIHGFGTGAVRQIARDLLATHPLVKSFRPGGRGEGGDGVTMVILSVRS